MRMRRKTLVFILTACVGGPALQADAQVQNPSPTFPSTVYPRRTDQPLPNTQIGPSSGLAASGVSTLPSGRPLSASGIGRVPVAGPAANALSGPSNPYWSRQTAVWDIQQRLSQLAPLRNDAQGPSTGATQERPAGLPMDYGLTGSRIGLDALARYSDSGRLALPARPAAVTTPAPPTPQTTPEPAPNGLDVPFEQFESYEEFRAWLTEQLAQPGGGAVGRALAQLEGVDHPSRAEASTPPGRGQLTESMRFQGPPPPIGYIGIGSRARTSLQMTNLGQDAALESARLVADLNQYLHSRQPRAGRQPGVAGSNLSRPAGRGAFPPPRSSLGLRGEGVEFSSRGYPSTPASGRNATPTQPRQYYQNLGGYQPPQPSLDWLPPGAGY